MAITLNQTFHVKAPIGDVWAFLLDPEQVVTCMPGAALDEVVGDDTFLGNIKVKVGPITASYKGKVQFTRVDEAAHHVEMKAEGVEASGGSASATMSSRLETAAEGGTTVFAEANAELTGRVMQFGRGMIQGISDRMFKEFASCVTERLESAHMGAEATSGVVVPPSTEQRAINGITLVLGTIWAGIVGLFRRLFGGKSQGSDS
jgi:carbon monoxide dehydrogenase subunit G